MKFSTPEAQAKYSQIAQNPVKVEGIEYSEKGAMKREVVSVHRQENLVIVNA